MMHHHSNTCFQMTTKTMSEMMTMTRSTSTAAATVSSGWGPVWDESQLSHMSVGEDIYLQDACRRNVLCESASLISRVSR